jgi:hypothetical protein
MRPVFDPQMSLLSTLLASVAAELESDAASPRAWSEARAALGAARAAEPDLAAAVDARDAEALRAIVAQWASGARLLPEHDREVLKRALKAFRKSLKVTRLDAESTIGGGPMSGGRRSGILGITPPARYPRAVWDELVRQKRLIASGHGIYELPPE